MNVTHSRVRIDARAEYVWAALTEVDLVAQWQYGSVLTTTWRVGSPIRFTSEWEGQHFEQWGTVLSFTPNSELSYSLFAPGPGVRDVPENYFTMSYRLETSGDATCLTIIKSDPRPNEGPQRSTDDVSGEPHPDETDTDNPVLSVLKELVEASSSR